MSFVPPRWWIISVIIIVAIGVAVVGVGRAIEQTPTGAVNPIQTPANPAKGHPLSSSPESSANHGPLPPDIPVYTGQTSPPLQSPFRAPSATLTPSRTRMPTLTPATPSHTPTPTPTPSPTVSTSASTPTLSSTGSP